MVRAHLHDEHVGVRGTVEDRKRQAEVVVEVAGRRMDAQSAGAQERSRQFLMPLLALIYCLLIFRYLNKINDLLTAYLREINIELIDFKLQFGRFHGRILVADEITPDTARFWDSKTHEPLDKDRFRRDMDNVAEAYQEVLHRMMGVG